MIYLWECTQCGGLAETEQSMKEDLRLPTSPCIECSSVSFNRVYEVPAIRTRTSKSYLDGQRRDKGWMEMKEAAKLEVEHASSNNEDDKKQIKQRIKELRTIKK